MNILDCGIFGSGGFFGNGLNNGSFEITDSQIAKILSGYNIYIQTGNATSIETLIAIDGGTSTTKDELSFSGGSSSD